MEFREGTPNHIILEIHFAVFGLPVLLGAMAILACLLTYRSRHRFRFAFLIIALVLILPSIGITWLYNGLWLLNDREYGTYVVCDPCF
jgi:high-affinity K+ transport system ATPase subunit B